MRSVLVSTVVHNLIVQVCLGLGLLDNYYECSGYSSVMFRCVKFADY